MATFGDRLKLLRENSGLTQQQLADNTNISRSSIAQYETNRKMPDPVGFKVLSDFFGVTLDYLLGFSDFPTSNIPDWLKNCPDPLKEKLIQYGEPFMRIAAKAVLNDLPWESLEQIVDAHIDAIKRNEEAKKQKNRG